MVWPIIDDKNSFGHKCTQEEINHQCCGSNWQAKGNMSQTTVQEQRCLVESTRWTRKWSMLFFAPLPITKKISEPRYSNAWSSGQHQIVSHLHLNRGQIYFKWKNCLAPERAVLKWKSIHMKWWHTWFDTRCREVRPWLVKCTVEPYNWHFKRPIEWSALLNVNVR